MAQKPKTRKFEVFYRDARYPKTILSAQVEAFNPTAARGAIRWDACEDGITISISKVVEIKEESAA
jgi:hypothetical protein